MVMDTITIMEITDFHYSNGIVLQNFGNSTILDIQKFPISGFLEVCNFWNSRISENLEYLKIHNFRILNSRFFLSGIFRIQKVILEFKKFQILGNYRSNGIPEIS